MNRRQRSDGQWEVLVNTPAGYTWQLESAPAPPVSNNPYASYNPMGRQQGVPASAYSKHTPYKNMFDAEFGSLLGDAFKYVPKNIGKQKTGGPRKSYAKEFPIDKYTSSLYLKRKQGRF